MVNWDVVGDNMRIAQERAREAWTSCAQGYQLTAAPARDEKRARLRARSHVIVRF